MSLNLLSGSTMSNLTVVKHNKLIEASYSLTLAEQRVLLAAIAQVDSTAELLPGNVFHVCASDIIDLALDRQNAYRDLKVAINKLYSRSIKIDGHDDEMRWIYRKTYDSNGGRATLYFSPEIIPYLSQLRANFTRYKLEHVAHFRSAYGIRLYELLVQWTSIGEREVELEWLRERLDLLDKYSSIKDLKARVIEPAMRDINDHSNLWVEFGQRKTGREVTHLQFKFGIKGGEQKAKKPKRLTDDQITAAARPGETTAQVISRLNGNDLSKTAMPGESIEQAKRKAELRRATLKELKTLKNQGETVAETFARVKSDKDKASAFLSSVKSSLKG